MERDRNLDEDPLFREALKTNGKLRELWAMLKEKEVHIPEEAVEIEQEEQYGEGQ